MKVHKQVELDRIKEQDSLNHLLGRYIIMAVNKPNSYPRKPYMHDAKLSTPDAKKSVAMSDDEMEAQARRNNILLGGKNI